jgi:insertion element IS1 protein InsB
MICKYCKGNCQKAGRQTNGTQKLFCKDCKKYQQNDYKYYAYNIKAVAAISGLVCESVGVRGIARILGIGVNTVIRKIKQIGSSIIKPKIPLNKDVFELDEIKTYVEKKENQYWIAYALCSKTRSVIDFVVGKRNKRTLQILTNTLLYSGVKKIKTDKLNIYQSLIPSRQHINAPYSINHIERHNLNIRTHLKRLSRRTICFSKSMLMLEACLKIYFWSPYRIANLGRTRQGFISRTFE